MVLEGKRPMPSTNLVEVIYRCETCGDQDETDGEGALTLSVQADLFGNPFEGVSIKRFQTA
jgi:hypothetical protein